LDLKGKVAIVTGAGGGIGRAIAELFARQGAATVVADMNADDAAATAGLIEKAGGRAIAVTVDVVRPDQIAAAVAQTAERFGGIDILVNNAATVFFGSTLETGEREWRRVLDINLTGPFLFSKAVVPHMVRRGGGSIVNISSSTGAHDAVAGMTAYVASKGGVTMLTKAMALDLVAEKIRVNAVAPGPTDTAMLRSHLSAAVLDAFVAGLPSKRLAQPEEIARAVLYLASDASSFVNGAILAVDGGQTAQIGKIG
jgi:NAD(P)-dependent dehydrogenase (short-subunit alcohol dehydrogenase family)